MERLELVTGLWVFPEGNTRRTSGLALGANQPQGAHIPTGGIGESGANAVGPAWVRFARNLASARLCLDWP